MISHYYLSDYVTGPTVIITARDSALLPNLDDYDDHVAYSWDDSHEEWPAEESDLSF